MTDVSLRPLEATDGAAIDVLMRSEAQSTRVSLSTEYLHDVYAALLAQHPTMYGVVAESAGIEGLAGMATAFTDEVAVGGGMVPAAHLENLKVHHDLRRQGVGGRLAAWRIDEARRRFGGDGVITAGVEATNTASLATAAHWASQVLGPVRVVIARPRSRPIDAGGTVIRPLEDRDVEAVIAGANAFYADHELYTPLSAPGLSASLATTALGWPVRRYRVAVARDGTVMAGAQATERYRLMVDHLGSLPVPVSIIGRLTGMVPADRTIRSIEVGGLWHAPGHVAEGRRLWEAIRYEWRDRTTNIVAQADPRGPLPAVIGGGMSLAPRIQIMIPVHSSTALREDRPVYLWR